MLNECAVFGVFKIEIHVSNSRLAGGFFVRQQVQLYQLIMIYGSFIMLSEWKLLQDLFDIDIDHTVSVMRAKATKVSAHFIYQSPSPTAVCRYVSESVCVCVCCAPMLNAHGTFDLSITLWHSEFPYLISNNKKRTICVDKHTCTCNQSSHRNRTKKNYP